MRLLQTKVKIMLILIKKNKSNKIMIKYKKLTKIHRRIPSLKIIKKIKYHRKMMLEWN